MLNKELIQEVFVPTPTRDENGKIIPAPLAARIMFESIKDEWHKKDLGNNLKTVVSMGPTVKDGVEGYSIRKEIVHKE